jgi:hypothetical protein
MQIHKYNRGMKYGETKKASVNKGQERVMESVIRADCGLGGDVGQIRDKKIGYIIVA